MILEARTLLGAPGHTTRSKKLLGAPGIVVRLADIVGGSNSSTANDSSTMGWHRYHCLNWRRPASRHSRSAAGPRRFPEFKAIALRLELVGWRRSLLQLKEDCFLFLSPLCALRCLQSRAEPRLSASHCQSVVGCLAFRAATSWEESMGCSGYAKASSLATLQPLRQIFQD